LAGFGGFACEMQADKVGDVDPRARALREFFRD
jgi:hypothetical protein